MTSQWVLEGYFDSQSQNIQRISIKQLPAYVGRDATLPLAINRVEISRKHAEFFERDGQLFLKDLNSTNGTFVNRIPLKGELAVFHGDVIHFATCEMRLLEEQDYASAVDETGMTRFSAMPLTNRLPTGVSELQVLLDNKAIKIALQPIVLIDGDLFGYEVLGRGARDDLPQSPMELFRIAESLVGKATQLSELMREKGAEKASELAISNKLFLNTHPEELKDVPRLLASVKTLRNAYPQLHLVLEIHEDAITDLELMKSFTEQLTANNIELAYDDFGAGQARLMEMSEVAVKYVKFDIALIRDLHNAPDAKRKMVAALAAMTRAMGIKALAEGVEVEQEWQLCQQMQFDLIQGYFFAKPSFSADYQNPLKR